MFSSVALTRLSPNDHFSYDRMCQYCKAHCNAFARHLRRVCCGDARQNQLSCCSTKLLFELRRGSVVNTDISNEVLLVPEVAYEKEFTALLPDVIQKFHRFCF